MSAPGRARRVLAQALLLAMAGCAPLATRLPPPQPPAQAPLLRLIGTATVPPLTRYGGTTVGGLSAIDYNAAQDTYLLISDDRSSHDPARIYTARLRYDATALAPPEFTGVHTLLHAGGRPYAPWLRAHPGMDVPDAEAVRWLPGGAQFVWTSEGDFSRGFGPQLRVSRADGAAVRDVAPPARFTPQAGSGPRSNGTLEGLALAPGRPPGHARIGRRTSAHHGHRPGERPSAAPDRLPTRRRAPGPPPALGAADERGERDPGRRCAPPAGAGARLQRRRRLCRAAVPHRHARGQRLTPANHHSPPKTLVADFAALGLDVDNLEGMTWGPSLPGGGAGGSTAGSCVLVFVSDDNFNPAQVTQFIAAEYLDPQGGHGRCGTTTASP